MNKITSTCFLLGCMLALSTTSFAVYANSDSTTSTIANTTVTDKSSKLDINVADIKALMKVDGIGKSKAKAIVQYRQQQGHIEQITELNQLRGFTPALLQRISNMFTIIHATTPS